MKTIKIVGLILALVCITTTIQAQCYGCCDAAFILRYDSVSDICRCAVRPYAQQGSARPVCGNIDETIVTYDSIIIRHLDPYYSIDTLYNLGTFNQATDTLKIDCSQLPDGCYALITTANIESNTDTLAVWGCTSFYKKISGRVEIKHRKSTKLDEVQVQEPNNPLLNLYAQNGRIFCSGDFRIYDILGRDVTRFNGILNGCYIVISGNHVGKIIVH